MRVKVCGMRDSENIRQLVELPIDYIGFIFYEKSPRYVSNRIEDVSLDVIENKKIKKVGVFVNADLNDIKRRAAENRLDAIQCHGDESPEYCFNLKKDGLTVFKAFRVGTTFNSDIVKKYQDTCDYYLFDTDTKSFGGSGLKFDWSVFKNYDQHTPVILSGGIGPGDEEALKSLNGLNLHAIDLNSKFEVSPGMKDVKRIREFLGRLGKI